MHAKHMEISGIVWLMQSANDIDLLLRLGVLFTFQSIVFSIHRDEEWGLRAYCMPSLSRVPSHTNHYVTITLPAILLLVFEVGGEEMKMMEGYTFT